MKVEKVIMVIMVTIEAVVKFFDKVEKIIDNGLAKIAFPAPAAFDRWNKTTKYIPQKEVFPDTFRGNIEKYVLADTDAERAEAVESIKKKQPFYIS